MNWIERRRRSHRRRRMVRLLLITGAGIGVLLLGGLALPSVRTTRGTVTLPRSRETIWSILIDLDGMPRWRSDLTRIERLPDLAGRRTWKETGPGGERIVQMVIADAPRRLVMRNAETTGPDERSIELEEVPSGTGTLVRVTERRPVAPIGRVIGLIRRQNTPRLLADLTRWLEGPRPQVASTP
jgi:uncharacterized protein YndB with AHSA1/START domain